MSPRKQGPVEDYYMPEPMSGCWIWLGGLGKAGYGMAWDGRRMVGAHRLVYVLLVGQVPDGTELDHLCRNPSCVNPAHLEPVTHHENMMRGKNLGPVNAAKTHCPQGHHYSQANTYFTTKGHRACRECGREYTRRYLERKAQAS